MKLDNLMRDLNELERFLESTVKPVFKELMKSVEENKAIGIEGFDVYSTKEGLVLCDNQNSSYLVESNGGLFLFNVKEVISKMTEDSWEIDLYEEDLTSSLSEKELDNFIDNIFRDEKAHEKYDIEKTFIRAGKGCVTEHLKCYHNDLFNRLVDSEIEEYWDDCYQDEFKWLSIKNAKAYINCNKDYRKELETLKALQTLLVNANAKLDNCNCIKVMENVFDIRDSFGISKDTFYIYTEVVNKGLI